jgi:hypothetical protein
MEWSGVGFVPRLIEFTGEVSQQVTLAVDRRRISSCIEEPHSKDEKQYIFFHTVIQF